MAGSAIGNFVGNLGNALGLPEFGISERLGGAPTPMLYDPHAGANLQSINTQSSVPGMRTAASYNTPNYNTSTPSGPAYNPVSKNPTPVNINNPTPPPGPSPVSFDPSQIDAIYQEYASKLPSAEDLQSQFSAPYEAYRPDIQNAQTQGLNLNTQQRADAQQGASSAISDASRLYNELTQGGRQRFGGSNSAGEFYQGYLGRELQRQTGNVQNQLGSNIRSLDTARQGIVDNYNTAIQKLDAQIAAAKQQAIATFQQMQSSLAGSKASDKIQSLQQYRQNLQAIENANAQYRQQMYAQAVGGLQQIAAYSSAYGQEANLPTTLQNYSNAVFPLIGGGNNANTQGVLPTGYYNPNDRRNQQQ